MTIDINKLTESMNNLFTEVVIKEKMIVLGDIKYDLVLKEKKIKSYLCNEEKKFVGRLGKEFCQKLKIIERDFQELQKNFDDKLMIFVVGDGNAGKSTILNCLVGEEVAPTNFLPSTWKIDVYSEEITKDNILIKFNNKDAITMDYSQAKRIVDEEEEKTKLSKDKYKNELKTKLRELKTKEEREEMKKFLAKKYIYKSNISEIRWPVSESALLKKSLLVDTPGRNQELNGMDQIGNMGDYYHKADGVIWVLDANTIASENSVKEFELLYKNLSEVGGVRDNIIGAVNKIDLAMRNGGEEALQSVKKSAQDIYGNKFSKIIYLSGKNAIDSIKKNNIEGIEESGINNLHKAIKELFIEKADSIKNGAKLQGRSILKNKLNSNIDIFLKQIKDISDEFFKKNRKLEENTKRSISSIENDIEKFFSAYLVATSRRIELHIDKLSEGYGTEFIKEKMYEISSFNTKKKTFEENKYIQVNNDLYSNKKITKISEYKHISIDEFINTDIVNETNNIKNINLADIKTFTPVEVEGIFSALGNIFGKVGFMFRKNGIKRDLNSKIKAECDKIEKDMKSNIISQIQNNGKYCEKLLHSNFESIMFEIDNLEDIQKKLEELKKRINEEKTKVNLREILNTK